MEIASARRAHSHVGALLVALIVCGGLPACRRRHETVPAAPADASAQRPVAAHLRGRVVDRRDHPVPAARILLFSEVSGGALGAPEPSRGATDFEGGFDIEGLAAGTYRVLIEAAGFPTREVPARAPASDLVLRIDGEGRSISGRVEFSGVPAVDAIVDLAAETGSAVRQARARADGGFVFVGLGTGAYALRAARGGLVSQIAHGIQIGRDGVRAPLRLALEPGQMVAGRVVDSGGTGLRGIEVRAEGAALAPGEDPLPAIARTDASAGFTIGPLLPGRYRLIAARPGYALRRAPTLDVVATGGRPPPVVLELLRGARVAGWVTDSRSTPVASAHVRCVASGIEDLTVETGPLPLAAEAAALPSGSGWALGSTRVALADGAGRFAVDDLIPGRYRVELAHVGFEPMRTAEFVVVPGERRDLGMLSLRDGFPVEGRVVDEDGAPIEGARVGVGGSAVGDSAAELYTLTDSGGRFLIAVPAGTYPLAASAPGHGAARATIDIKAGALTTPVELRLARAEAVLEGLVRDSGGRPLARARLRAWPRDTPAGAGPPETSPLGSASADFGGHFRVRELPSGELRLEVEHPDYPSTKFSVVPGQYALLTVPVPGGIAGEAHARATGAAVVRGRVEAAGPDGAKASTDLQRSGGFRLPRLVPGHWRLTISAPGFRPAEQEVDVPASANLGEMSVRELRVELDPA
jgi:hypothetical protein